MTSLKAYFKKIFSRFGQMLYLTISNFTKNALWESAAACAFGFIFSFIPVTMIIFTVLVGILRIYPNIYNFIISFTEQFDSVVKITPVLDRLLKIRSFSSFNIFLAVWVIWMARKLFNSIIIAMNKVFRSVSRRKSWFNQILTFIIEFSITLIIAVVIIAAFVFSQIISLPFFQTVLAYFPLLEKQSSSNLATFVLYFILFLSTVIAYRVIPGTKPLLRRCIFYSALSTAAFFIVSWFLNMFMNVTNYNAVYGTISSLVVLMMKVYLFFIIFLFCAQMIYVSQFFETLLRSEIYQLPGYDSKGMGNYLRRFLFINPSEIQTEMNTVYLKAGQVLYTRDQKVSFVYFIKIGAVSEESDKGFTLRSQGSFLGDVQCILNQNYQCTATALADCELISFTSEEFMQIIEKSHHAARKAISKISEYTATAYDED
ncbi:YhjD/YihY/BrkB family envelope integrity protein [Treponema bryantii]|uniref:YhjD/YihY/BrkB family envelope integrity protein n=1 Tax=Treponema bryantii TaxID=163 RepID=UPI0003B6AE16|nr:YhjD/YihY/BrkB family envelope integrity protein [Treponema bryantii]